jgi:hypothetical protein
MLEGVVGETIDATVILEDVGEASDCGGMPVLIGEGVISAVEEYPDGVIRPGVFDTIELSVVPPVSDNGEERLESKSSRLLASPLLELEKYAESRCSSAGFSTSASPAGGGWRDVGELRVMTPVEECVDNKKAIDAGTYYREGLFRTSIPIDDT